MRPEPGLSNGSDSTKGLWGRPRAKGARGASFGGAQFQHPLPPSAASEGRLTQGHPRRELSRRAGQETASLRCRDSLCLCRKERLMP